MSKPMIVLTIGLGLIAEISLVDKLTLLRTQNADAATRIEIATADHDVDIDDSGIRRDTLYDPADDYRNVWTPSGLSLYLVVCPLADDVCLAGFQAWSHAISTVLSESINNVWLALCEGQDVATIREIADKWSVPTRISVIRDVRMFPRVTGLRFVPLGLFMRDGRVSAVVRGRPSSSLARHASARAAATEKKRTFWGTEGAFRDLIESPKITDLVGVNP